MRANSTLQQELINGVGKQKCEESGAGHLKKMVSFGGDSQVHISASYSGATTV
jgi:hypothetical protein